MTYPLLARATAGLSLALAMVLLCGPAIIFWLFSLDASLTGEVLARRAAVLFLGFTLLLWQLRDLAPHSPSAKAIAKSMAAVMLSLALLGLTELALGRVGTGILIAIATELAFFLGWMKVLKSQST
jgi:hypothetical protein